MSYFFTTLYGGIFFSKISSIAIAFSSEVYLVLLPNGFSPSSPYALYLLTHSCNVALETPWVFAALYIVRLPPIISSTNLIRSSKGILFIVIKIHSSNIVHFLYLKCLLLGECIKARDGYFLWSFLLINIKPMITF